MHMYALISNGFPTISKFVHGFQNLSMDFKSFPQIKNSFPSLWRIGQNGVRSERGRRRRRKRRRMLTIRQQVVFFHPPQFFCIFYCPQVVFVFVGFLFYVPAVCFCMFLTARIYFLYFFTAGFFNHPQSFLLPAGFLYLFFDRPQVFCCF